MLYIYILMSIKLKVVKSRNDKSIKPNFLHLNISGSSVNYIIVNTIRRIILNHIPIHAFNYDDIIITKNTSVYNNNYMKNNESW